VSERSWDTNFIFSGVNGAITDANFTIGLLMISVLNLTPSLLTGDTDLNLPRPGV